MGIFTIETFSSVYNKSGLDISILSILGHVITLRAKKSQIPISSLMINKMENGGNCFIKTLVVQFMTFGPFYIFYGSLQTCILAHLLNSQCNKNNVSLLSFLATKICWKIKFKTKSWSKICKKWAIFNPETVLKSFPQILFKKYFKMLNLCCVSA